MNRNFKDLLSTFCAQGVEFLVVGAHALAAYGHIRATKDIDVWINATPDNARRVLQGLAQFGAPLAGIGVGDFERPSLMYQIGVPPIRIDILTSIDGVSFAEAWTERFITTFDGVAVPVISKRHLIVNKRASARHQDLADVEKLEAPDP